MKNCTIINKIEREKELSLQLVERVRSIIEGEKINSQYLPIDITSFSFDYLFTAKFDELFINQLELKYKQMHSIYRRVFQSYFEIVEYPYEGELNYKSKRIAEEDKVSAMEDLVFLEAITKEFISYLNRLEKNENVLSQNCLEKAS
jgi:hypothetical protein